MAEGGRPRWLRLSAPIAAAALGFLPSAASGQLVWEETEQIDLKANGSQAIAIADVTGDGRDDILVTMAWSPVLELRVYEQGPNGSLEAPTAYAFPDEATDSDPFQLATGDFNVDGATDAAVTTSQGVWLYIQKNGKLDGPQVPVLAGQQPPDVEPFPSGATVIKTDDLDQDGDVEMVVGLSDCGGVEVISPVAGGFESQVVGAGSICVGAIGFGDLDSDGLREIVSHAVAYERTESGQYEGRSLPSDGVFTSDLAAVGDVTGDGRDELIETDEFDDQLIIWPQLADGTFRSEPDRCQAGIHTNPHVAKVVDLDGDALNDIAMFGSDGRVVLQRASGGWSDFSQLPFLALNSNVPYRTAFGDLNDDGKLDGGAIPIGATSLNVTLQSPESGPTTPDPPACISPQPPDPPPLDVQLHSAMLVHERRDGPNNLLLIRTTGGTGTGDDVVRASLGAEKARTKESSPSNGLVEWTISPQSANGRGRDLLDRLRQVLRRHDVVRPDGEFVPGNGGEEGSVARFRITKYGEWFPAKYPN